MGNKHSRRTVLKKKEDEKKKEDQSHTTSFLANMLKRFNFAFNGRLCNKQKREITATNQKGCC